MDPDILRAKVQVFVELYQQGEEMKQQALEIAAYRCAEEEFQRATELEQRLVGIVGHDIRTPLMAILTTAQAQLASSPLAPAQRIAFERVARGGERIRQIVDLLLDFTRARLGGGIPVVLQAGDRIATQRHATNTAFAFVFLCTARGRRFVARASSACRRRRSDQPERQDSPR